MKSLLYSLHCIGFDSVFAQTQEIVFILAKPPVFLPVTSDDFLFSMPVFAIALKNKIAVRKIEINKPWAYLLLCLKWLVKCYQYLFNSDFKGRTASLLESTLGASKTITRTEYALSIPDLCWLAFEDFSAPLAGTFNESVMPMGFATGGFKPFAYTLMRTKSSIIAILCNLKRFSTTFTHLLYWLLFVPWSTAFQYIYGVLSIYLQVGVSVFPGFSYANLVCFATNALNGVPWQQCTHILSSSKRKVNFQDFNLFWCPEILAVCVKSSPMLFLECRSLAWNRAILAGCFLIGLGAENCTACLACKFYLLFLVPGNPFMGFKEFGTFFDTQDLSFGLQGISRKAGN